MKFKRHFFVCTNDRPRGAIPACSHSESPDIYKYLVDELAKRNLFDDVAVTATGCLGPCFDGPIIVVYPEGTWYGKVTEKDCKLIAESHMQNGKPVEKLAFKWPEQEKRDISL